MHFTQCIAITILVLNSTTASVLLWSSEDIEIPALPEFTSADLRDLEFDTHTQVIAFTSKSLDVAQRFNRILNKAHTAYVPNAHIILDNAYELSGQEDVNTLESILQPYLFTNTTVALIVDDVIRFKRKTNDFSFSTIEPSEAYQEPINGPIVYSSVLPSDKTTEAMIYSSKPPLLKLNSSSILLGDATVTKIDVRDSYTRLIATIPVENGKISLRFKFNWISGYWYLNSVEVEFVDAQIKQYNLTSTYYLTAPRHFSYHCGESTILTDLENSVELHLFDVQAQPDAHNHRFDDAYHCVPFTTAPILSGIFVTFILEIGLVVGLTAINSIKTMDKFDNHKTKQLTITVSE